MSDERLPQTLTNAEYVETYRLLLAHLGMIQMLCQISNADMMSILHSVLIGMMVVHDLDEEDIADALCRPIADLVADPGVPYRMKGATSAADFTATITGDKPDPSEVN